MTRIHELAQQQAVDGQRIDTLEQGQRDLWAAVSRIRDEVGRVKVEVGKVVTVVGIVQVIATGLIVWSLTR